MHDKPDWNRLITYPAVLKTWNSFFRTRHGTLTEAIKVLDTAIKLYNQERPHFSISLLTPEQVHSKEINVEKLWKNYYNKNSKIVNLLQDNKEPVNALQD